MRVAALDDVLDLAGGRISWLHGLTVRFVAAETLTAADGAVFTGFMFEISCVVRDRAEEEVAAPPAVWQVLEPTHKFVWCIARRYRQFIELYRSFRVPRVKALKLPSGGWFWQSSTENCS